MASSLCGLSLVGLLLFLPAGTFSYWQARVFIALFTAATILPSIYLARTHPAALQRRMHGGPRAENRTIQKIIVVGAFLGFFAMTALSAFDHRFGWSSPPTAVVWAGDALVVAGLCTAMLVVVQNSYAAATVRVEAGQTLASRGLYRIVRHPMYSASVVMMAGVPLALGSYWGLLFLAPGLLTLICRILDEEKLLTQELNGYREYKQWVRYRLLPYVW